LATELGADPKLIRGAIVLMRRGCADLLAEVIAGRLRLETAVKLARGRS
jgi:hypothetical protein